MWPKVNVIWPKVSVVWPKGSVVWPKGSVAESECSARRLHLTTTGHAEPPRTRAIRPRIIRP
eukprot:512601-Pyramimonas_sp.AAC.2